MSNRDARGRKRRFDAQIAPATIDDAPAILDLQKLAYHSEAILYRDWSIPPLTQTLAELRAEFTDWKILKARRESARLKMAGAGMCFDDHPAASADDALERESIMKLSMQRAGEWYGAPFAGSVYVGDGVWDARACRSLGIPFIGIGSGARAARLASEGAVRVFQDFSEEGLFLESLDELSQAV